MEFIWNKALPGGGQCIPGDIVVAVAYTGFAIGIGTDFIFALLPIPMLWNVQLNWRVKLAIMGILSLGLLYAAQSPHSLFPLPDLALVANMCLPSSIQHHCRGHCQDHVHFEPWKGG